MLDSGHFEDQLERLERDVLAMDRAGDASIVHLLFRTVHNLKSSSAQSGLVALAGDLHGLEDTLDRVRRGRAPWTTDCYDQVTRVIDRVRSALRGELQEPGPAAPEPSGAEALRPPAEPGPAGPGHWGPALAGEERAACDLAAAVGLGIYRIEKLFRRGLDEQTFRELPVMQDIADLGKLIAVHPSWAEYDQGPEEQVVTFQFASARTAAELSEVLFDPLLVLLEPRAKPQVRRKERLRFLVVEDDPTTGLLMQYILRQHGDAVLCGTGAEGLAAFREGLEQGRPFDLAVLDLILPDRHGDDILREIREDEFQSGIHSPEARCQVIINTSNGELDQMMRSLQQDPDGYLIKPINVDILIEKVCALKAERIV